MRVIPSGQVLGAVIEDVDVSTALSAQQFKSIVNALAVHGVISFPKQALTPAQQKAFASRFGSLEVNVGSKNYQEPGHPEIMILSNIVEDGKPLGLADAGQDWHTDMSYSREIAYTNVLYGLKIPRRYGVPLGGTEFSNMVAAYADLPTEVKEKIEGATATHDFNKFWEKMRTEKGSSRPPLTDEQRKAKPPVSQPMVMTHPISGKKSLYANPGYAVVIDGWDRTESDRMLSFLFSHQLDARYRYKHKWNENDVLMWDNLTTIHNAVADYAADEHRLIKRCQVMADWVLSDAARAIRGSSAA